MTEPGRSTRQRLTHAALQLFTAQGMTATTTRQIAELADVNEVTLFRQFGNKQGLLLALLEDPDLLTQLGEALGQQARQANTVTEAVQTYAQMQLRAVEQTPELVRSLIGEAGYPVETAQALGQRLNQLNQYTAQYLATVLHQQSFQTRLPIEKTASLLNALILGYAVIDLITPFYDWQQSEFLAELSTLLLQGALVPSASLQVEFPSSVVPVAIADLPAAIVHTLLKQAKKQGLQPYALAYVLFAAGLSATEVAGLSRSHSLSDSHQHLLQVNRGTVQQVPLNQWILGQRYGTPDRNPLTQWLKSRKDDQAALFLNEAGRPMSEVEIRLHWQDWVETVSPSAERSLAIEQAQHTWAVEMLVKGMSLEDLSLLTGLTLTQLQPYAHRAREKAALEQARRLDQKT